MWLKKYTCNRCNKPIEKEQELTIIHCMSGEKLTLHFTCLYQSIAQKVVPIALESFRSDVQKGLDKIKNLALQMPSEKDLEKLKPKGVKEWS